MLPVLHFLPMFGAFGRVFADFLLFKFKRIGELDQPSASNSEQRVGGANGGIFFVLLQLPAAIN